MTDLLSDVLRRVRLKTRRENRMFFSPPWGVRFPGCEGVTFILVGRGSCVVESRDSNLRAVMSSEDIALVSGPFDMHDGAGSTLIPIDELRQAPKPSCTDTAKHQARGETWILASSFTFEGPFSDVVTSVLGPLSHLRSDQDESALWLRSIFHLIAKEACQEAPGSEFAHSRILELYFLQFLRAAMARHAVSGKACSNSMLRVLFDPQLSRAVEMIHRYPARDWSVGELAAEAAMSRTAFAVRFSEVAGLPPLAYLTKWRMIQATELLDSGMVLETVASRVGYVSVAAFSRAFKREFGVPPGAYRRSGFIAERLTA